MHTPLYKRMGRHRQTPPQATRRYCAVWMAGTETYGNALLIHAYGVTFGVM